MALFSVEQYHRALQSGAIAENTELLEGVVISKMTESPRHAAVVTALRRALERLLPEHLLIRDSKPITSTESEPEPDISVVAGNERSFYAAHPTTAVLVIEVAVTSLALDREKAAIYARANIPEYWIVNLNEDVVDVYSEPDGIEYKANRRYTREEAIQPRMGHGEIRLMDIL